MRSDHLSILVIRPTLARLAEVNAKLYSDAAVELLLGTAAQESDCGDFLKQIGGPALGIYQIEPATHHDIINRYLARRSNWDLRDAIAGLASRDRGIGNDDQLVTNLAYATAIARVRYWMSPKPLPAAGDLHALANYWDEVYNGNPFHGTPDEFIDSYNHFIRGAP